MNIDNYLLLNKKTSDIFLLKTSYALYNIKDSSIDSLSIKTGINSKIFDFARKIFEKIDYKMDMRVIYSTDVYPEILIKNNQGSIIWDLCFWQLYEKFVKYMLFLEEYDSIYEQNNFIDQYKNDLIYYLANRLDDYAEISYVLSEEFMMNSLNMPVKFKLMEGGNLDFILTNAQIIALFHERNHYLFKNNRDEYARCFNAASDIIRLAYKEDKEMQNLCDKILNNADDNIIEEMLCDYRAVLETIEMNIDLKDSLYRLQEIFKAFLFYTMVIENLNVVDQFWNNIINLHTNTKIVGKNIFTSRESSLIRCKVCEDLILYSCILLLKRDPCFKIKKYIDLDYKVLGQAVHYVCSETFVNEIVNNANQYSEKGCKKEILDKEKMDIFLRYWNP